MLRLVCSALVASALVLIPAMFATQSADQARAEATEKAEKAEKGKAEKGKTTEKKATRKKRELTPGQKAARERQKQCGREWREAKQQGKIEKGQTWPKYWSACNTRLKRKSG